VAWFSSRTASLALPERWSLSAFARVMAAMRPATAYPHAWATSNLVDQLVPRSQHGKIVPPASERLGPLTIRTCRDWPAEGHRHVRAPDLRREILVAGDA
jgi:hypothetical protein